MSEKLFDAGGAMISDDADLENWSQPEPTENDAMPTEAAARKDIPLGTGVLDYFPDALAAVAHVSFIGNLQHNPGQPLHWSRGKSGDHWDSLLRHGFDRGKIDAVDGCLHSAKLAWRALALLQEEIETRRGDGTVSRGSRGLPANFGAPTPNTAIDPRLLSQLPPGFEVIAHTEPDGVFYIWRADVNGEAYVGSRHPTSVAAFNAAWAFYRTLNI